MKITEIELVESSGYSLEGSMTHDLNVSKMWLIDEIEKIKNTFSTIYVLGAWYSNTSLYIKMNSNITAKKIINVETNREFLETAKSLHKIANVDDNVEFMFKDANNLDYRQLDRNGLVINTSLTDMKGEDWFGNIPSGTMVALQARNQDPGRQFNGPEDILKIYPLKVLYQGSKHLQDPETEYDRFMVIGIKE